MREHLNSAVREPDSSEPNALTSRPASASANFLDRQKHFVDQNHVEFDFSLLRCRYAEACRQRDQVNTSTGWRGLAMAKSLDLLRQFLRTAAWAADTAAGSVRTIRKLSQMTTLCDRADVVSFDVFDTLLYRTVEPPDYLKRVAANFAAERYAARGYPVTAELVLYLRRDSEWRQRRLAQSRGCDTECNLSEVIREVLYRLFGSEVADADANLLVQNELEIERQHLRVADGVPQLLQQLKSRGRRIVATSDTYLEQTHLQELFLHLGISRWIDAIYASSEHGVGKYSGRLFQEVLKKERIEPRQLIHVGDTYHSDVRGAVKAGVPAVFLFDIERLGRRRRMAREIEPITLSDRPAVPLKAQELAVPELPPVSRERQPELYRIGFDILGPAFTLFVLDVIQEACRINAADIYYLAREGRLFGRLHEILTTRVPVLRPSKQLRHHYLYVSRLATSLPAIRKLSDREVHLASYRDRHATLAECLAAFGLDLNEFNDLSVDFTNCDQAAKADLFANPEFANRVSARSEAARACLRAYLVQEGFFNPHEVKVVVDIGWNATIQANLTHAFEDDPEFPLVVGYYFGRRYRHEDYLVSPRSLFMPGRLFDQKRPAGAEHAIGHCLELFELAAAAPHGATLGYEAHDGQVAPVLSDEGGALMPEQTLLQSGIVDYALSFAGYHVSRGFDLTALRGQSHGRLAQLILRPTATQARALRNLSHSLDWGSRQHRPLISPEISPSLALAPRRFYNALKESYWLEGCMRLSQIPGALIGLAIARRALRARDLAGRLGRATSHYFLPRSLGS